MALKLNSLYSETKLFGRVDFHPGINIILGAYKSETKEKSELNGIGKSTLIRLIDFALLSDPTSSKHFDVKKHDFFKDHCVTLEFEIDGKKYFIKRNFNEPRRPLYGEDISSLETYEINELRRILGTLFFLQERYDGVIKVGWFRDLLKFFIKDDVNRFHRTDPLNFVHTHTRKFENYSYNLFLLGLPNKSVSDFDSLTYKKTDLSKQKTKLTSRVEEDTGKKLNEINAEIRFLDEKVLRFQKTIDDYKFMNTYEDVEKKLIDIALKVTKILSTLTILNRRLNEYKKSYQYEVEFNKDKVVKFYAEVKSLIGQAIDKELTDVLNFRRKLSESRMKFLEKKEESLVKDIEKLKKEVSVLEIERRSLYKILDEKKALDSIKNTYTLLIEEKAKKEKLSTFVMQVDKINQDLIDLNQKITKTISEIAQEVSESAEKRNQIASLFFEIIDQCINTENKHEISFDITPNPDMTSPLNIEIAVPKSEALGKTRLKILSYDLTVFLNIIQNSRALPHFLIHDGVFHGIDVRTVIKILNYMYSKFLQNPNFQYIVTANENEVFIPEDKKNIYGKYDFDLVESTIVTYKDIPEDMIFRKEY